MDLTEREVRAWAALFAGRRFPTVHPPEVRARSGHLDLELLAREDRMRQNMPRRPGGAV